MMGDLPPWVSPAYSIEQAKAYKTAKEWFDNATVAELQAMRNIIAEWYNLD